jgi:hypothetical protein
MDLKFVVVTHGMAVARDGAAVPMTENQGADMIAQATPSLRHLIAATLAAALGLSGCMDIETLDDTDPENVESTESSILTTPTYVHRAYKSSNGEHFYTESFWEAQSGGYQLEFVNYYALETGQPNLGWVPFYRCWWENAGKHLYTVVPGCESTQARNEGRIGFIATTWVSGTVPLYRLYKPSNHDHLYTTSWDEVLLAYYNLAYSYEGVVGYVYPKP